MAAKTLFRALLALTCFVAFASAQNGFESGQSAFASGQRNSAVHKSVDDYKSDSEDVSLKPKQIIETDDRGNAAISDDHINDRRVGAVPNQSYRRHSPHQNFHQAADPKHQPKEDLIKSSVGRQPGSGVHHFQPLNQLFKKVLNKGDVFVFPMGLIHVQRNVGYGKDVAVGALNSESPGVITIANSVFGSNPSIPSDVLGKAFQVDQNVIFQLLAKF
ncbi:hypothetical protein POUND7_003912 [Theobroma cacao]